MIFDIRAACRNTYVYHEDCDATWYIFKLHITTRANTFVQNTKYITASTVNDKIFEFKIEWIFSLAVITKFVE